MAKYAHEHYPETIVVIGAGASVGLGVPTMVNFMDKTIDRLTKLERDRSADSAKRCVSGRRKCMRSPILQPIQDFIQEVRASASYARIDFLNIEEIYGLADMYKQLLFRKIGRNTDIREEFNRAIYLMTIGAGEELISEVQVYRRVAQQIEMLKHESHTEDPQFCGQNSHSNNLVAYISLASFVDAAGKHPLCIQFNWDLAFDRALYVWDSKSNGNGGATSGATPSPFPWTLTKDKMRADHTFTKHPLVVRPHGGIHWHRIKGERSRTPKAKCDLHDRISARWQPVIDNYVSDNRYHVTDNAVQIDDLVYRHDLWKVDTGQPMVYEGTDMLIAPPTWQKNILQYQEHWRTIARYLRFARRIIFLGYSLPRSDLYFRHFFALALAKNNHAPKVYVWNPAVFCDGPERESYLDLFAPLARDGRLLGINGRFGDPALLDVSRAMHLAQQL